MRTFVESASDGEALLRSDLSPAVRAQSRRHPVACPGRIVGQPHDDSLAGALFGADGQPLAQSLNIGGAPPCGALAAPRRQHWQCPA